MYAVVETGGKQVRLRAGDVVRIERLSASPGDEVRFDRVLCVSGDGRMVPGNPTVPGAVVVGTVLAQRRGPKIVVFKYKAKANYRRKSGHRQAQTVVRIADVRVPGWTADVEQADAAPGDAPVPGEENQPEAGAAGEPGSTASG